MNTAESDWLNYWRRIDGFYFIASLDGCGSHQQNAPLRASQPNAHANVPSGVLDGHISVDIRKEAKANA
jgi:hypothetical protein